jgi:alpha-ketoglutarate-dependent taurine dioxygenase
MDSHQNNRLPFLVESDHETQPSVDGLLSYFRERRDYFEDNHLRYGGVLFRGFNVNTPSSFKRVAGEIGGNLLSYTDGNSPRKKLGGGVYTSTEYPPDYFISLHNELSYSHQWPSRLFFGCIMAPTKGGETPIADSRLILRTLDPAIVEEFSRKKIKYLRNLHSGKGMGPSWQETFETTDKLVVEKYLREGSLDFKWNEDGGLRLSQVRDAIAYHPKTGEPVWFNQADQFHLSTHPKEVSEAMMKICSTTDDLPQNATFGDDTPMSVPMLDEIRRTVMSCAVLFPWSEGDVLVIDNMLTCHGRMPFEGPRKIVVSMS